MYKTKYRYLKLFLITPLLTFININSDVIKNYSTYEYKNFILKSFKTDWYWLIPDGGIYNPLSLLPEYNGQDTIKILLNNDKPAGYITYKMQNTIIGFIHFLYINKANRGKGYAKKLLQHAIADLKSQGAKVITLMTRTNNIGAQKVYKQLGFKEKPLDEKYIDFVLKV